MNKSKFSTPNLLYLELYHNNNKTHTKVLVLRMVSLYNSTDHVFLRLLELVSDKNLEEYEAVCRKKH